MDRKPENHHSDIDDTGNGVRSAVTPQLIRGGNPQRASELLQLLTANYARLLAKLTGKFGSIDFAAETLHDVYVKIRSGMVAPEITRPSAYLYRMAVNHGLNRVRRDKRLPLIDPSALESFVDLAPDPERIAAAIVELRALSRGLVNLPQKRKAIFLRRWRDEKEIDIIAKEFGLHARTVQKELERAEIYLRDLLER